MKVVVLCGDAPNQVTLVNLLHKEFGIDQLVIWKPFFSEKVKGIENFANPKRILLGFFNLPYRRAWFQLMHHYTKVFPDFPNVSTLRTTDINSKEVATKIRSLENTLFVVSGTNLLSQPLLELVQSSSKVINLHTGISPYVKGGPNCTNWCLANNQLSRIGNSVLWIDKGIDSGNLIATEQTDIRGVSSLLELHIRVMDHAHELYVRVIRRVLSDQVVPSVAQWNFVEKNLYFTKDWNLRARIKGLLNYVIRFKIRKNFSSRHENLILVNLTTPNRNL